MRNLETVLCTICSNSLSICLFRNSHVIIYCREVSNGVQPTFFPAHNPTPLYNKNTHQLNPNKHILTHNINIIYHLLLPIPTFFSHSNPSPLPNIHYSTLHHNLDILIIIKILSLDPLIYLVDPSIYIYPDTCDNFSEFNSSKLSEIKKYIYSFFCCCLTC